MYVVFFPPFFSCPSHTLHFCPANLYQSVEKLKSLAFFCPPKIFSRTAILVTSVMKILSQALHSPDELLKRFLGSMPVAAWVATSSWIVNVFRTEVWRGPLPRPPAWGPGSCQGSGQQHWRVPRRSSHTRHCHGASLWGEPWERANHPGPVRSDP